MFLVPNDCALPSGSGSISGDPNPPPYSVINVDVDTYVGPTVIDPSIIASLNDAEGTFLLRFLFPHFR